MYSPGECAVFACHIGAYGGSGRLFTHGGCLFMCLGRGFEPDEVMREGERREGQVHTSGTTSCIFVVKWAPLVLYGWKVWIGNTTTCQCQDTIVSSHGIFKFNQHL